MSDAPIPTAFVAMKFDGHPWKDKRYKAIKDILQDSGFNAIRADEIPTSGPVVDEVCKYLREAELVVIDSSGDSHSVSYEVGYCHGINRPPDKTILLHAGSVIPFNYRHFRHRCYKDLRELRQLLRLALQVSLPLQPDQYGYVFSFKTTSSSGYILKAASVLFNILRQKKFSGRCECYSGERPHFANSFVVSLCLRKSQGKGVTPDYKWWMDVVDRLILALRKHPDLSLNRDLCELAEKRAIQTYDSLTGSAEFKNGAIVQILGTEEEDFFKRYVANPEYFPKK